MWDINAIVSGLFDVARANSNQLLIGLTTIVAAMIASRATNGANRVKKRELDFTKKKSERESTMQEQARAREIELSENQLTISRQEALYDKTYKLISTLENQIEQQTKKQSQEREEFRQEREGLRQEIRGFRAQVLKLERRVAQLVRAFRETTGQEPPPEEEDEPPAH